MPTNFEDYLKTVQIDRELGSQGGIENEFFEKDEINMLKESNDGEQIKVLAKDYEYENIVGENDVSLKMFDKNSNESPNFD